MSNSDKWTAGELERSVSRLTANLLRIMAGAGRVVDLGNQLKEANTLLNQVVDQQGWPAADDAMYNGLQLRNPYFKTKSKSDELFLEEQWAEKSIVRYSLRIAAAEIQSDNSNASKNSTELRSDIRRFNEIKAEKTKLNTRRVKSLP